MNCNHKLFTDYDYNGVEIQHCELCGEYWVKTENWVAKDLISEAFSEVSDLGIVEYP